LHLIEAWPQVEKIDPSAQLEILGDGPLRDTVQNWVAAKPDTRRWDGMVPREQILKTMQRATVLVAPSVRDGRWREQVGRPILEGLASGLTIVTTTETGLARWLMAHGHCVINPGDLRAHLGTEIIDVLRAPLAVQQVQDALPDEDGRIAADIWLHQDAIQPGDLLPGG
jgi:glycosyltransferase involved in cell wall biosynthesis